MLAVARKHRKALRSLVSALYLVWPGYRTFDPQPEQTHGGHFQTGLLLTSFVSCPAAFTLPDIKDLSHDLEFTLDHPQGSKCTEK